MKITKTLFEFALVGFLLALFVIIAEAPVRLYEKGVWDCSDIARAVFFQDKREGGNPTMEYGCEFPNFNAHAWVLDSEGKVICGGNVWKYRYNRRTLHTLKEANEWCGMN